ncbi:hypothetical protein D050_3299B, partial [Vibrio parahaemolyticus VPCR-2009]
YQTSSKRFKKPF